jgi:hypothetical protein
MKYLLMLALAFASFTTLAAGNKCRLTTMDGTWEYIGAPEDFSRLPGGVTLSTAQGTIQVVDGEVVGGMLGQFIVMSDGSIKVLPATVSDGTIELDKTTCRIRAEINSGMTVKGVDVPASIVGKGEYSRIARAIVGRARSLLTGGSSTFVLRRP